MNEKQFKRYNQIMLRNITVTVRSTNDVDKLRGIKKSVYSVNLDEDLRHNIIIMLNKKINNIKEQNKDKVIISEPMAFNSIKNTISDEQIAIIKDKINSIKDVKVKYHFEGLFNLLTDKNLIYNQMYKRHQIINYLLTFKSLNGFKVGYISVNDLDKKYSFLSVKGDKVIDYSKIQLINNCVVFNTVTTDNITVKVLYANKNDVKKFKKDYNKKTSYKMANRFNIDCLDFKSINQLSNKDKIIYYSYLKNNLLHKRNRQLLKDIRKHQYTYVDKKELLTDLKKQITDILNLDLFNNECQGTYEQLIKYFYLDFINNNKCQGIYEQIKNIEHQEDIFKNNSLNDIKTDIKEYYYL